jgi:NAD(P)-dependent dehydrogenase (short-subunit alcohol dehydrogenase family)
VWNLCTAGIQYVSPVEEFPEDKWDDIIAVCLNSAFHATKAALPYMLQQGWGRIINTGSMHALVASPYKSAYNAAKHGIAGFTKTVALELAQKNITCNAICPGYVLTGQWLPAASPLQSIAHRSCSRLFGCRMRTHGMCIVCRSRGVYHMNLCSHAYTFRLFWSLLLGSHSVTGCYIDTSL